MPNIVRGGGLNFAEDTVIIRDIVQDSLAVKPKSQPEAGGQADDAGTADFLPSHGIEPEHTAAQEYAQGPAPHGAGEEIIKAAMAEAAKILEDALREGEAKKAQLLDDAQAQAQQQKDETLAQAYKEGVAGVLGDMQQAANQVEMAIARFEAGRASFEAEYEGQLKWLALEIATKVLVKKVDENDAQMMEMVQMAIHGIKNEPWIRVDVAQEMVQLIDGLSRLYEGQANVQISAVPAQPGSVQIETPSGIVDVSLKTQLENLREYFAQNMQ